MKRYYALDGGGRVLGHYAISQEGLSLEFLEEPNYADDLVYWNGNAWQLDLANKKNSVADSVASMAAQIMTLSDMVVHDFQEQGAQSDYTQAEYDAEIIKRKNIKTQLSSKFLAIKTATTPEELYTVESEVTEIRQAQIRLYAQDLVDRA